MSVVDHLLTRVAIGDPAPEALELFDALEPFHESFVEFIGMRDDEGLGVFVVEIPIGDLDAVREDVRQTAVAVLDAADIAGTGEYPDWLPSALDPTSFASDAQIIESLASRALHPEDGASWADSYAAYLAASLGLHALHSVSPVSVWKGPATAGEFKQAASEAGSDWLFGTTSGRQRLLQQAGYGDPVYTTVRSRDLVILPDYGQLAENHFSANRQRPVVPPRTR